MKALEAAGLGVEDIDFVMCTHLHRDHVGWNTRLENGRWVPTFPKARYLVLEEGIRLLTSSARALCRLTRRQRAADCGGQSRRLVASDHALDDHFG